LQDVVVVTAVADMSEAVQFAAETATEGDVVLLSPACASFDMFSGYGARGDAFVVAVERIMEAGA